MKHLYNGLEYGIYQDHKGHMFTGPILHRLIKDHKSHLICGLTWEQIKQIQSGVK